jgi:glycosyltransferase involved in cell wall biosynthesis
MPRSSVLLLAGVTSDGPSMARYARELFTALVALDDQPHAVAMEQPSAPKYLSRFWTHAQARRIDAAWHRYVAYPRSVRRQHADIFHILDQAYAPLIRGVDPDRTVVTCHDVIPLLAAEHAIPIEIPATVARTFRARVHQLARARRVITGTCATKATLEQYTDVPADRIVVIPYGINESFRPIPDARLSRRRTLGVTDSARVVLQVATAARYKNTPGLLQALTHLRRRIPDLMLVRIGAPLFPDEVELADTLGVADLIQEAGTVTDRDLVEWYSAADVLVFPSLWEGFGWPAVEAMACGTPVVASNIPALVEVIGDAGVLVPPDAGSIANATERVLTDAALADGLREKGLARARRYTWSAAARRTADVYDDVLH